MRGMGKAGETIENEKRRTLPSLPGFRKRILHGGVQNGEARFAGVESGKRARFAGPANAGLKVGEPGRVSRVSKMTKLSFVNEKLNWTSYTHSPAGVMSRIGLTGVQNGNRRRGIGTGYDGA